MKSSARGDIFLGLGVIALALITNFVIIPAGVSLPPKVPFKALEPAFWPNIIIYVLVFLNFLLNAVGFIVASVVLLPVFMWLMGERRYWLMALIGVVLPFALHFFFRYVATVYVPLGFLEPWLG